ncbi:MAG: DUF4340 domain-containing protein [Alphaproteobacteria bacterium]|nr:DUF4340 domain-containing protein [Alphaproteobacteria bacterium]
MSTRALTILAICTLVGVLLAAWAINQEWSSWGAREHQTKVFPDLNEQLDTVDRILLDGANGRMTLKRQGDGWLLEESDDHPVRNKAIQRLLFSLSELSRLEPKTEMPERFAKLQLEDPTAKGAKSMRVQVLNKQGGALSDIVVGKENLMLQVIGEGGVYIREPGKKQAWLASGDLTVGAELKDWLQNRIMDIAADRVERATISHPNGDVLTVVRDLSKEKNFAFEDLGANEKLQSDFYPSDIGRALADLEMSDARKRHKVPFDADKTTKAEFRTVDGLTIRLELMTVDGEDWLRVASISIGDGPAADMKALEKEIAQISTRTKDWAYQLPEFESVHLKKRRSEVVEEVKTGS